MPVEDAKLPPELLKKIQTGTSFEKTAEETLSNLDYEWTHDANTLVQQITELHIATIIQCTLLESFLSEQATRFIAMDNATRNADNFLSSLKLHYNKLRQAKITKELIELLGNFDGFSS